METRTLGRSPSLQKEANESDSPSFRRGHIRRSSYESAQIQLNFSRRKTAQSQKPSLERDHSLPCSSSTETNRDSVSSRCEREETETNSISSGSCSLTVDSGLDDVSVGSDSKNSSLDRKCDMSEWESSFLPTKSPSSGFKSKLLNFPKSMFSRKKIDKTEVSRIKVHDSDVLSTTSLILEDRPSDLPAKSNEELAKHRQLHMKLVEQAKRKEELAERHRKQVLVEQKRLEEQTMAACRVWTQQILPKWSEMRDSKRCRELWWQGVPTKVRGRVWSLVIGNDLNITKDSYDVNLLKASSCLKNLQLVDSDQIREDYLSQINLDVSRTFPFLGIFQQGGPYHEHLLTLLSVYVCSRPDVGYVQSMSFIAAILLLQMEPFPAFVAFSNLLNRPLQEDFFGLEQSKITKYFLAYDIYFKQELPTLHSHFDVLNVRPDMYLIEWIFTLFAKSVPLDVTCRIWDVYLRDGEEFLFKTTIGILRMYESFLLGMDFEDIVTFLTHLPDELSVCDLFRNIEPLMRTYPSSSLHSKSKKRFQQILRDVDDRLRLRNGERNHNELSLKAQELTMSKSMSGFVEDFLRND